MANPVPFIFLSSSSDDEDDEEFILNFLVGKGGNVKAPRIKNYVENVVHLYRDHEFKSHFRMGRQTFEAVLRLIAPDIQKKDKSGRYPVSPEKQLFVCLWVLATPDSYRSVCDRFDVGKASGIRSVRKVVNALYNKRNLFIKWPNEEETRENMRKFQRTSAFPNVLGSIDGTHIAISSPAENPEAYINRKGYHSIQLQAVCDSETRFIHVFAGFPGSVHDQRVFLNSEVNDYLNDENKFPHDSHLVGDPAYQIHRKMMVPFKDNGALTLRERNFNFCQSSARIAIERAFGLLKGRFRRLLHHLEMTRTDLIPRFIVACCILHNICIHYNDNLDPEEVIVDLQNEENPPEANNGNNLEKELGRAKRLEIMAMLPIRDN